MFPNAKVLDINLTSSKITTKTISSGIYRRYPGGSALALYIILNQMPFTVDPLSPENILVFSVSPLTGLPASGLSRVAVTTKSPLTGAVGDSQAGGFFPIHLKGNGYDAVVIRGKADQPVYLYINGNDVQIRGAKNVWGKVTGEAEQIIRQEIGDTKLEIAQIGPGGENLVKYACILNMCNRANGRLGTGAVMGSKNLKALVVKKTRGIKPVDPEGFRNISKTVVQRLKENLAVAGLNKHGTDGHLEYFSNAGFLVTKNWNTGYFPEGAHNITGETMTETILKERDTCYSCAVRCKRVVEIPELVDPLYGGPEYETCATFGSYCGIGSLASIALANQLCNMYGLDTISCGATIAFAMECFEKGLIDQSETDGLELTFGNTEIIPILIEKIAKREGFGGLLAEGSKRAAEIIGGEARELSISVKGEELPAHMPQNKPGLGLIYAVNPYGADHQSSEHDPLLILPPESEPRKRLAQIGIWKGYDDPFVIDNEKVRFAFNTQCFYSALDILCLCQFVWGPAWQLFGPSDLVELCKFGLGWETSVYELMLIGERRINMMRYFNASNGFTRDDDKLPKRIFKPLQDGPSSGIAVDEESFEEAKGFYYELAGWDQETGNPKPEKLKKLSLEWLLAK